MLGRQADRQADRQGMKLLQRRQYYKLEEAIFKGND
jgi:hypothetical protein